MTIGIEVTIVAAARMDVGVIATDCELLPYALPDEVWLVTDDISFISSYWSVVRSVFLGL